MHLRGLEADAGLRSVHLSDERGSQSLKAERPVTDPLSFKHAKLVCCLN